MPKNIPLTVELIFYIGGSLREVIDYLKSIKIQKKQQSLRLN